MYINIHRIKEKISKVSISMQMKCYVSVKMISNTIYRLTQETKRRPWSNVKFWQDQEIAR